MSRPIVSVVLGSYNRFVFLKMTIETVRKELSHTPHEIIVVDGGSTDGTPGWLTEQGDIITIVQHNRGVWEGNPIERKSWGYFMNLAFRSATGRYVCMLSDDCLVIAGAITRGIAHFEQRLDSGEKIGASAFYWRNWPEQSAYVVGLTFGGLMFVNHGLYLRSALEQVGFIDEDRFFFYHADGDLCLRMADAGYICIDAPDSYIEHFSHTNQNVRASNLLKQQADWAAYEERWGRLGRPPKDWVEKSYVDPERTAERYWRSFSPGWFHKQMLKIQDVIAQFRV